MKSVSIVILAYNCERWIGPPIESVLSQTWPRKEIIIVDDGSTDKTLSIINNYERKSVRVVHRQNAGVASARNCGLKYAEGDYIQWLGSDDILARDKIEKQMEAIERMTPIY